MKQPVKVPSAGESVTEAFIGAWKKKTGDMVRKGEVIVDLESQKATFELAAEFSGKLEIIKATAGERVRVGDVIAYIDDSATAEAGSPSPQSSPTLPAGRQV
ncbi:MAG: biotin/lipoyl-binding protein, partial [Deltaproteobacteria bacterium]|nr:biotin/lipoyl-binding protein [Deltaproteobacteria bacterium]